MSRNTLLAAIALLVVGTAIGSEITVLANSPRPFAVTQYRQDWEYFSTECPSSTFPLVNNQFGTSEEILPSTSELTCQSMLIGLGREGWELVSVVVTDTAYFSFKRPY
ncbi:MAG: hypothetical protein U0452_11785 [Anaerolineae bacterium]